MKRLTLQNLLISTMITACWFSNPLIAADDRFSRVEIKPVKLNDTSYMFVGSGGNIGVSAGPDGILIIDDQFAPLADKISRALADIQAGAPKFVINTHYHGDHTGSNAHFGQDGTIMAHHNVLKRLSDNAELPPTALPVITYQQGISVHFNGDTLNVLHMGPGHTDGDSVIIWGNKQIVHMGDLYFKDRFPYIDLEAGGSVIGYRDNVADIIKQINTDTKVIPGHGELATKEELIRFKHMLDDSIHWMKEQKQSGHSLSQMQQAGIPPKWRDWSWRFISEAQWIETLDQGL